jgi:hypothetical protein
MVQAKHAGKNHLQVSRLKKRFEDESDLYREVLGGSDEAVLWPGMLVYKNILGKTGERPEEFLDSVILLGESEDLVMADGTVQGTEKFSSEYAEESDTSPDLEIGMALGSTYRTICKEMDLPHLQPHEEAIEATASKVVQDTVELDPDTVVYNLESINSEPLAEELQTELENADYDASYSMKDGSYNEPGFSESHVWGTK